MADGGVGAIDLSKVWDVNGPDALVTLTISALLAQSFVVAGWILLGTYMTTLNFSQATHACIC